MNEENKMELMVHESFTMGDVVSSLGRAVNIENDPNCEVRFEGVAMAEHKDMRRGTAMIGIKVEIKSHDSPTLIKKRACENLERKRRGQINDIRTCTDKLVDISRDVNDLIKTVNRISRKCCKGGQKCRCETVTAQLAYTTTKKARESRDRARSSSRGRSLSRSHSAGRRGMVDARSYAGSYSSCRNNGSRYRSSSRGGRDRVGRSASRERGVSSISVQRGGRQVRELSRSPEPASVRMERSVSVRATSYPAEPSPDRDVVLTPPRLPSPSPSPSQSPARNVREVEEGERAITSTCHTNNSPSVMNSTVNELVAAPPTPLDHEPDDFVTNMELGTPATSTAWDTAELESLADYDLELFVSLNDQNIVDVGSVETLSVDTAEMRRGEGDPASRQQGKIPATAAQVAPPAGIHNTVAAPHHITASAEQQQETAGFWPGSESHGVAIIQSARDKVCLQIRDLAPRNAVLSLEMLYARHCYTNINMRGKREFSENWFITKQDLNHSHLVLEARQFDRSGVYKTTLIAAMNEFRHKFSYMGWQAITNSRILSRETVVRVRVAEVLVMRQLEDLRKDESGRLLKWDEFMARHQLLELVAAGLRIASVEQFALEHEEYCLPHHPPAVRAHVQRLRGKELLYNLERYIATRCGDRVREGMAAELQPTEGSYIFSDEFRVGLKPGAATSEAGGITILLPDLTRPQSGLYL